ncbi:ImmA/IrrE family metallo-endopeptidase [Candidatus Palauibacter sp.]|uniref:ImmA/IrrE family metallo-endopeptidase n=1 Tax=Candidatus Palauibacter sp. TaxID=3101350 RepID=UPI003C6EA6D7
MNSEGLRFARRFRQALELRDVRQCDLTEIAAADGIEVIDFDDPDPGCTACLLPNPHGDGGAIFLKPGQNTGRRRFSIAHELAHYHIPTHRRRDRRCKESSLQATRGFGGEVEWEANSFAAELLMPAKLFRADARELDVSFEAAYQLMSPDGYGVSATAAARRIVQVSEESCALVATRNGSVEWQERSNFYYRMATHGQRIRGGTLAAAVTRRESANARCERVDAAEWLDDPHACEVTLLESTHAIPSLGQVLSLLWVPDADG